MTKDDVKALPCPHCGELGLLPLGGEGARWVEHWCGAYSQLKTSLKEAYESEWVLVDPGLNARTVPPVGGTTIEDEIDMLYASLGKCSREGEGSPPRKGQPARNTEG